MKNRSRSPVDSLPSMTPEELKAAEEFDDASEMHRFTDREIEDQYCDCNWIRFHKDFMYLLNPIECIILSFLVSVSHRTHSLKCRNGWFYCEIKRMRMELAVTRRQHDHAIKGLKEKGIIKVDFRGMPAVRYIKIQYRFLKREAAKAFEKWVDANPDLPWNGE